VVEVEFQQQALEDPVVQVVEEDKLLHMQVEQVIVHQLVLLKEIMEEQQEVEVEVPEQQVLQDQYHQEVTKLE
jgi:hypothetical protein